MAVPAARCPIGGEMIDENSARLNATFVVFLLVAALLAPHRWILAIIVVDYAAKLFTGFRYSPICRAASAAANVLRLAPRMTDSAPKRFAATIGLFMATAGLLLAYLLPGVPVAFYAVTGTFLLFASLEAFVGFCMGCFLYSYIPERAATAFVRRMREARDGGV